MSEIESVVLMTYVRVAAGANGEQVSTLDPRRTPGLTVKEAPLGVQVLRDGVLFSLVPWTQVRQIVYAPKAAK